MKTITLNLYNYSELSDSAKQNALNNYCNDGEFIAGDDYLATLKKALEFFNGSLDDYSIDWMEPYRSNYKFSLDKNAENLQGVRLFKYIENNFSTYRNPYTNKIEPTFAGNCPFTGCSSDEDFLDPIRVFMKKPDNTTFEDLIKDCIESLLSAACKDAEYEQSEENFIEMCEANEYTFEKDGTINNGIS